MAVRYGRRMMIRSVMRQWFNNPVAEILSGLVVAFAMIPEAIAFSGIAGVDPQASSAPSASRSRSRSWVAAAP